MTAKEQLARVGGAALVKDRPATFTIPPMARSCARTALDAFLAHPDLLLALLAETGVLTEETVLHSPKYDVEWRRYVSPWVPSGDQT